MILECAELPYRWNSSKAGLTRRDVSECGILRLTIRENSIVYVSVPRSHLPIRCIHSAIDLTRSQDMSFHPFGTLDGLLNEPQYRRDDHIPEPALWVSPELIRVF